MDAVLVVDVANVMGSTPDGWWRDRRGAAGRLLTALADLPGTTARAPDGGEVRVVEVVAVVEGAARTVDAPAGVTVCRAAADGDTAVVAEAGERARQGSRVLVVTADRGLRRRLPDEVDVTGPHWLNDLIGR